MSVLVKGMEMPESCSTCELCACYAESKGDVYRCDITMYPVKYFEKRLDNCPLVEVPYEELLKAAKAMHTWIFLNSVDEQEAYDECGLSDEMNALLGYYGQFIAMDGET